MEKKLRLVAFAAAFVGMGISMPQCPGQQALQQQVDGLETKSADTSRKMQMVDNELKRMNQELVTAKTLLEKVSNTVLAQQQAIDRIDGAMKAQAAASAAARSRPAPKAAPKRRR
jgi:hypothetical protein